MDVATAVGLVALALAVGVYGSIIGAGGGFLMVAGLVVIFDLSGATAVGTSVVTTLCIQATGAFTYSRQGLVARPVALWFAVGSIPAALLSALFLAGRLPDATFEVLIGVLMLALAVFVLFRPAPREEDGHIAEPRRVELATSGSLIGVLSGAFGVGSGLITVPLLSRLQRLAAHRAAATTTLIGTLSGAAATLGHTFAGNPRWSHVPFTVVGAVAGARLGALNAVRLSARTVLALLAAGLVAAGVALLIRHV